MNVIVHPCGQGDLQLPQDKWAQILQGNVVPQGKWAQVLRGKVIALFKFLGET